MPTISIPSKIAGTRDYTDHVIFSGSTSSEREAKVEEVIKETGAILVPPYDHPDIILGQGTTGYEIDQQYQEIYTSDPDRIAHPSHPHLDAVISPCGGGGLLSGLATYFSQPFSSSTTTTTNSPSKTLVFGAEPSFSGADDVVRGLSSTPPHRIPHVSSLTIADGLRTPLSPLTWSVISDKSKVEGVFAVTESQIKYAMRLVMERVKVWIEPSAAVGMGVVLFCEEFRRLVPEEGGWDLGIVLTGGNYTVEGMVGLYNSDRDGEEEEEEEEKVKREEGLLGKDGEERVEDVAG